MYVCSLYTQQLLSDFDENFRLFLDLGKVYRVVKTTFVSLPTSNSNPSRRCMSISVFYTCLFFPGRIRVI